MAYKDEMLELEYGAVAAASKYRLDKGDQINETLGELEILTLSIAHQPEEDKKGGEAV